VHVGNRGRDHSGAFKEIAGIQVDILLCRIATAIVEQASPTTKRLDGTMERRVKTMLQVPSETRNDVIQGQISEASPAQSSNRDRN